MKRRINRSKMYIVFVILFVCIILLSVAYAVLSTTLNITGSSEVVASSWNIEITKISPDFVETSIEPCTLGSCGDYYIEYGGSQLIKDPIVSNTSISDFEISVSKPGDNLYLLFKVQNNGSIPAIYKGFSNNTPVIELTTSNSDDVAWGESNLTYSSLMFDTTGMSIIESDSVLCPGDYFLFNVVVGIMDGVTSVSSSTLNISNLGTEHFFVQGDKSLCD